MSQRKSHIERNTHETEIELDLCVDGAGERSVHTPLPFFNHMLESFARHGLFDLAIRATGDVDVDSHHTVEDVGLVLGAAFQDALGDRAGIVRFGSFTLPMDETLVTCAVDFGGRPAFVWNVAGLDGRWVGGFDCELGKEFFAAFSNRAACNLHVLLHYGGNAHHILEAIFKAFARACDAATSIDPRLAGSVPSTKGSLSV